MGRRWLFSRTFAHGYNTHCVRFFFIFHRISIRFSSGFRLVFRFSQALLVAVVHTRFMCGVRIFFLRLYLFWMSFLFVFFSVDPTACLVLVDSLFAVACRRRMHSGPISRQCPIPQRINGLVPLFFLFFFLPSFFVRATKSPNCWFYVTFTIQGSVRMTRNEFQYSDNIVIISWALSISPSVTCCLCQCQNASCRPSNRCHPTTSVYTHGFNAAVALIQIVGR